MNTEWFLKVELLLGKSWLMFQVINHTVNYASISKSKQSVFAWWNYWTWCREVGLQIISFFWHTLIVLIPRITQTHTKQLGVYNFMIFKQSDFPKKCSSQLFTGEKNQHLRELSEVDSIQSNQYLIGIDSSYLYQD